MGFVVLTLSIYLTVGLFLKNPVQVEPGKIPNEEEILSRKEEKLTLKMLRPCWQTNIMEDIPPAKPKPKPKKRFSPIPKRVKLPPIESLYGWVGVIVHSSPDKSFAILLDKRTNRQILTKVGKKLPNTNYEILQIQSDEIRISTGENIALLEPVRKIYTSINSGSTAESAFPFFASRHKRDAKTVLIDFASKNPN